MTKVSHAYFRRQIEGHFEDHDYDIVCRKRKSGYAIHWADDNEPLARLRPIGRNDEVEVFWWGDDRWQAVGEFGSVMPLDDALEYVTDDPDDLFFAAHADAAKDQRDARAAHRRAFVNGILRRVHRWAVACALLAAAAGGIFPSPAQGCLWGAASAFLVTSGLVLWRMRGAELFWTPLVLAVLVIGTPVVLVGAAAGCIGGGVHQAVGTGVWGATLGVLAGSLCSRLMFASPAMSWLLGFSAGLALSTQLVDMMAWREHLLGLVIVALVAVVAAKICRSMAVAYSSAIAPIYAPSKPA